MLIRAGRTDGETVLWKASSCGLKNTFIQDRGSPVRHYCLAGRSSPCPPTPQSSLPLPSPLYYLERVGSGRGGEV